MTGPRVEGTMKQRTILVALVTGALLVSACASSKKDPTAGTRVLNAVVSERDHESTASTATGYQGTGSYYIVFEVHEGQAASRYRLEVSRQQFYRYPEGSHVQITLSNNILVDIRSIE